MGSVWKGSQQMRWAALIMGVSILLSRFMGLIRDKVISYLFGASTEADLYFAAFVIPDFLSYLLAGAYFSITLIPLLATYFEKDEEEGWRFFSAAFLWIGFGITVLTGIAMASTPQLARLAAPGLDPQALARLTLFLRIILPSQIAFLLGACLAAILYLRKQFLVPALAPLIYNGSIIAGGIVFRERGMEGFCWGVLLGAILGNFLVPLAAVRLGGGLKWRFSLFHPGLKRFFLLALPLMLGQSIVVLDEQFVRIFGSLAGTGAISWLNYARRIMMVPVGVVAQAAGVASYPFLADLVAKQEMARFHETLNGALKSVLTLLIPLSFWMMVVSQPTVAFIFEQGSFSPRDTLQTAGLLRIFLACVFCWGLQQIIGRGFYAHQDTVTPAVLGTLTTLISIPVFYLAADHLGASGVAGASAFSIAIYTAILLFWWGHRFGTEAYFGLAGALGRLMAVSLAACVPAALVVHFNPIDSVLHPYRAALYAIGASGLCFVAFFLPLSLRFAGPLVLPFLRKVKRP